MFRIFRLTLLHCSLHDDTRTQLPAASVVKAIEPHLVFSAIAGSFVPVLTFFLASFMHSFFAFASDFVFVIVIALSLLLQTVPSGIR